MVTYLEVVLEVIVEISLARELLHEGGRELLVLARHADVWTGLRLVGIGAAAWRSLHVSIRFHKCLLRILVKVITVDCNSIS